MYPLWFIGLLCMMRIVSAQTWVTNPIPLDGSTGAAPDVDLTYNSNTKQAFAAWGDSKSSLPYYSIYDSTLMTWTTDTIPLGTSSGVSSDVKLVYNVNAKQVFGTWQDGNTGAPYYSTYDSTLKTWKTNTIPLGTSAGVRNEICLAYVSFGLTNGIVVAWANSSAFQPYYSFYNNTSLSWTTGTIPNSPSGVAQDVALVYDSSNNEVIATWNDNTSRFPYYSVGSYDGATGSITWTTPDQFPVGNSSGAFNNVFLTFDSNTNQVFAVWSDSITREPYYSTYNGKSWTTASPIPLGASTGVLNDVSLAFNPNTNRVFAVWGDAASPSPPYYSIYEGGSSWSLTTDAIPLNGSRGVENDVNLIFDPDANQMIAAWGNNSPLKSGLPSVPYYSIFSIPNPPTNGTGIRIANRFPYETEYFNLLRWTGPSGVNGYNITRNGILIASGFSETTYEDHDRSKNGVDVYVITSIGVSGNESDQSLTITVGK